MEAPTDSETARQALLEAVENQLRDNKPPVTRETFIRLTEEGFSADDAKKMICMALANEVSEIMNSNETFNEARYAQNLANLPDLPWEE